jgi:hypothetical protein
VRKRDGIQGSGILAEVVGPHAHTLAGKGIMGYRPTCLSRLRQLSELAPVAKVPQARLPGKRPPGYWCIPRSELRPRSELEKTCVGGTSSSRLRLTGATRCRGDESARVLVRHVPGDRP